MKRILVTGAGGSASSNFITSIRASSEKFYIVGCDIRPYHLELSNVDKAYIIPSFFDPSYLTKINEIINKEKIDFLHAQPDPEVYFISQNREDIKTKVFLPEKKTLAICQNKNDLLNLLKAKGVSIAESSLLNSQEDLEQAVTNLLKTNSKVWIRATKGAGAKASIPINNVSDGLAWVSYWQRMKNLGYGQFMVSEFLPGKEFAFQSLWKDGQLITSAARERVEYIFGFMTISGQTSSPSIAKSVYRDDVNKIATEAILAVDSRATGVFCVDLKEDKEGVPCVTEINAGRFFTTSNFFSEAGSNMPYYYLKLAFNEELPTLPQYNSVPKDLYWVRMMDMGYKLVKEGEWKSKKI